MPPAKRKKSTTRGGGPEPRVGPARPEGAGPPYVVRWHPGAEEERNASWPPQERVAMHHAVEKLAAAGPHLRHPHSSAVRGAAATGYRELRPRAGRSRWRPIYRQAAREVFVILAVAPEAEIDPRGFQAAMARAAARFSAIDLGHDATG